MALEDEKTRPAQRAVRRTPATDLETRRVAPVKRHPFARVRRVSVERKALPNEAGEEREGWVLRDALLAEPPAWFAARDGAPETWDVLTSAAVAGRLIVDRAATATRAGQARVVDERRSLRARLTADGAMTVVVLDVDSQPRLSFTRLSTEQHRLSAGARPVATLTRFAAPGGRLEIDLAFEEVATADDRFVACCAVLFAELSYQATREARRADHAQRKREDERRRARGW